jgi:hypothetical protein
MGLSPAEQYCNEFIMRHTLTQLVETELWYFAFDTSVHRMSKRDYIPVFKNTMCIITHLGANYAKVIVPSIGESFFVLRTFMRKL